MANPRNEAVKLLCKIEKDSSYAALSLASAFGKNEFSDSRDLAFAVSLVYGVLEHKLTLDYNISLYLKSDIGKLRDTVLNILRAGAFQILCLDRVPDSAAVNEAVKSSKKLKVPYASGLINAVLRRISENGICLPEKDDKIRYLSIKYSVSADIAKLFINQYGFDRTEKILSAFEGRRPVYIRHNNVKCSEKKLLEELEKDNISWKKTELEGCFTIDNTGDIAELSAYKKGYFHVQDISSQTCCRLLSALPGETVVDCCSAPGGKSFTVAEIMENRGEVISSDIYEHKTKLIKDGASRLGLSSVKTVCSDARNLPSHIKSADRVLCDVPCSGFGVIGRKPEIRYKKIDEVKALPALQLEILEKCSVMVKPGGTLIYSTCTLNDAENSEVCDAFLQKHPDFSVSDDAYYRSFTDRYITFYPSADGPDGFFTAKFIRG